MSHERSSDFTNDTAGDGSPTPERLSGAAEPIPWKVRLLLDMQATVAELRSAQEDPGYVDWVRARYLAVLEQAENDPLLDQLTAAVRSLGEEMQALRTLLEDTRARLDDAIASGGFRSPERLPKQRLLFDSPDEAIPAHPLHDEP